MKSIVTIAACIAGIITNFLLAIILFGAGAETNEVVPFLIASTAAYAVGFYATVAKPKSKVK